MTEGLFVITMFGIPMVMLVVLVFNVTRNEGRRDQLRYEERRLMIERGMTPPDDNAKKARPPSDYLLPGLLLLFLGIGLLVSPPLLLDIGSGSLGRAIMACGIIIGLLGMGNLVYYRLSIRSA